MARIRTVKPEYWTDPDMVALPLEARLAFIGLLNFADDYGVLKDDPARLKLQILPADQVDFAGIVDALVESGHLLRRVAPDGTRVLVIRTFCEHQKIDRRAIGRWGTPDQFKEAECSYSSASSAGSQQPATATTTTATAVDGSESRPSLTRSATAATPSPTARVGTPDTPQPAETPTPTDPAPSPPIPTIPADSQPIPTDSPPGRERKGRERNGEENSRALALVAEVVPDRPSGGAQYFEAFWNEYPRKVGKGAALKAWKSACKRHGSHLIIRSAILHAEAWRDAGTETQFIPHPATWLNRDGWHDELAQPPAQTNGAVLSKSSQALVAAAQRTMMERLR